jgi:benzodiazapine receptor
VALATIPLVAGSLVGVATNARGQRWYRRLAKPRWTPPDGVFGPVWTVLYLLMGASASLVARRLRRAPAGDAAGSLPLAAFGVQLVLNLLWSVLFFGTRRVRLALVDIAALWIAILATMALFARVRMLAAVLLLPYLAWTSFAALLNLEIARRNPDV